jgi:hypothetical protein
MLDGEICLGVVQCALDIKKDIIDWVLRFPSSMRGLVTSGVASVMWALWKTRNDACFDGIFSYDPTSVIAQTAYWIDIWNNLQIPGRRGLQRRGSRTLLRVAAEIFSKKKGWAPMVLRLAR